MPDTAAPAITLAVPLDDILRLKPFVSLKEMHYYLNGVHYEPGAEGCALLVATDGRRMGVLNVLDAHVSGSGVVRLPAVKPKMPSHQRKDRQWLVVGKFAGEELAIVVAFPHSIKADHVVEAAELSSALAIYAAPLIDGKFPDWRKVMPKKLGRKTASFNPALLGDFTKAAGTKAASLTLYGDSDSEPHIAQTNSGDFIGVVMPMPSDGIGALPAWLDEPKSAARVEGLAA